MAIEEIDGPCVFILDFRNRRAYCDWCLCLWGVIAVLMLCLCSVVFTGGNRRSELIVYVVFMLCL